MKKMTIQHLIEVIKAVAAPINNFYDVDLWGGCYVQYDADTNELWVYDDNEDLTKNGKDLTENEIKDYIGCIEDVYHCEFNFV